MSSGETAEMGDILATEADLLGMIMEVTNFQNFITSQNNTNTRQYSYFKEDSHPTTNDVYIISQVVMYGFAYVKKCYSVGSSWHFFSIVFYYST